MATVGLSDLVPGKWKVINNTTEGPQHRPTTVQLKKDLIDSIAIEETLPDEVIHGELDGLLRGHTQQLGHQAAGQAGEPLVSYHLGRMATLSKQSDFNLKDRSGTTSNYFVIPEPEGGKKVELH